MMPVIPCSISNISLIPATAFTGKKNNRLARCSSTSRPTKHTIPSQRYVLPLSSSLRYFSQYRGRCALRHRPGLHVLSATGIDVAVEETNSPSADEESAGTSDTPPSAVETTESSSTESDAGPTQTQSRRSRPARKSEMPPVKNEELVAGATFTGKVRSIQPFGAFIDFGAFTDGLVHVSRLSDSYVKDVGSIVSVGQEVKVRLLEANAETGRISLTMRESDDPSTLQQQKDAPSSNEKGRPARRNTSKPGQRRNEGKTTKFIKGQDLEGTVKNLTRAGAFINLPEDEEGFLPTSEESDDGYGQMTGGSSLQIGQEVSVRVLRISRGQVTLTMKKEEDESESQVAQGVVHVATNPFMLAFRKNKDIAAFLDERDKAEKAATESEKPNKDPVSIVSDSSESVDGALQTIEKETEESAEILASEGSVSTENRMIEETPSTDLSGQIAGQVLSSESPKDEEVIESQTEDAIAKDEVQIETPAAEEQKTEETTKTLAPEESASSENQIIEEAPSTDLSGDTAEQVMSSESPKEDKAIESQTEDAIAKDEVQIEMPAAEEQKTEEITKTLAPEGSASSENQVIEEAPSTDLSGDTAEQVMSSESPKEDKAIESQTDDAITKDKVQIQTPSAESETPAAPDEDGAVGATPEKNGSITSSATISPALVKQLREETGAGMMDCKKALAETGGDIVKALEFLRKKGLASAEKKASRATAEGRIGSYIHDSRIGVLVEVNCETDFVSRGDIFKELVDDLAMQVAACPQVQYLATEDVPEEFVNKEREIEMQKEDLLSKPEQIRSKIVEGRIRKRLEELALLEQPYIKNDKMVIKDWVKQTIATVGENMKVKRFVRFNLGEGLEKKSQDFAAEVAAQTSAKPTEKAQPAAVETKETVQKPPAVAVSAALVKQLREETGAGMMDCKKALAETEGDLEKAQEYLRKKGLSAADKKSSRIAAEGRIGSYIHDSRIGVLIEVNCETDFVGRSEKFKELVDDLAMQVVASPLVQFVSIEDIPQDVVNKEKEIEMQREDLQSKPENIREKIVEGRVSKRLGELALLEQPFIKDDSILVKDLVKQTVAGLGENIKVRRFVRFTLGETIDDTKTETEA